MERSQEITAREVTINRNLQGNFVVFHLVILVLTRVRENTQTL